MKILGLVIALALGVFGLTRLLTGDCEDAIRTEIRSPDGKYTATLYERDCGATTDFSTILNLRESLTKFKGNDLGPIIVKGQHRIELAWDGNTRLRLQCSDCRPEEIFKEERGWKDIEISFGH